MKAVFGALNSSYTHTNAAVRILACALRPRHEAVITETTVNEKGGVLSYVERLYAERGDMYAFSVYIWNREEQLAAARMIKSLLPECAVIAGGPELSFEEEDFLERHPYIDYLIRGEGERVICDIADGKYERGTIIDGGVYEAFGESHEPYYCHPHSDRADTDGKLVYYETSRGCPYACAYCLSSVKHGGKARVRCKPCDVCEKEISVLLSRRIRTLKFVDRTFNFDSARAKRLFSHILTEARGMMRDGRYTGPTCHFEICAALIDDETVEILSRAPEGLFRFEIGVQTTTPESLAAINRRNDTEKILANVKKLRERTNAVLHLDLICGLPLDTYEGIGRSFDAIYPLCDKLQLGFLKLLRGTRLREEAEKYGMIYLDVPPYTVSATSTLTFDEMSRLRRIEKTVDRFSPDGGFAAAMHFLTERSAGAFGFFEALSEYLEPLGQVPSKKMYTLLYDFGKEYLALDEPSVRELGERLRFDFLMSESGAVPAAIERKYTDTEKELLLQVRRDVIGEIRSGGMTDMFIPALEVHIFSFDSENVFAIDRKKRVFRKIRSSDLCNLYNIFGENCAKDKF